MVANTSLIDCHQNKMKYILVVDNFDTKEIANFRKEKDKLYSCAIHLLYSMNILLK